MSIKISSNTRLAYIAMLIALSAVGSLIKIQGSIAFDSMPGFFAALFLGPVAGALVAGIGHFLSALTSGFPYTLPMHLIVAAEMALFAFIFGWVYRRSNGIIASIVATILNGPVAALVVVPTSIFFGLPFNGWPLFYLLLPTLTIASAANVILAYVVYKGINRRMIK
ncbi:MAG: ECF transporter S component [Firmicutes bacterium]|nr:ECF transporter S component [Bacillota bacterium]